MQSRHPTPGSQTSLREANRARIVESLKRHGHLTQVELSGATGLSAATISNIVKELSGAGVVNTSATSHSGRRAVEVTLARRPGLVAGLHVSKRHLRVAISDVDRTVVAENHLPLASDHRHDREMDRAALLISDMVEALDASVSDLLVLGMALPHPVDPVTGMISTPGLMRGWDGVAIADAMSERIQLPVFVDTEANLGCLAEVRSGAARGIGSSVYIRVGNSIGGSLLINGSAYRGGSGRAGEVGHIMIDPHGPLCACGNRGCLEAFAGGPALLEQFREDAGIHRLRDLLIRAEAGDSGPQRAIADAGRHIGAAAATISTLFDPDLIVIGGEMAEAGELLLAPLRHELERASIGTSGPAVVPGMLGDRAAVLGCLAAAIDNVAAEWKPQIR